MIINAHRFTLGRIRTSKCCSLSELSSNVFMNYVTSDYRKILLSVLFSSGRSESVPFKGSCLGLFAQYCPSTVTVLSVPSRSILTDHEMNAIKRDKKNRKIP